MDKGKTIQLMVSEFEKSNRMLCEQAGMHPSEIDAKVQESAISILYIMTNMYDSLEKEGIFKS